MIKRLKTVQQGFEALTFPTLQLVQFLLLIYIGFEKVFESLT